jgi:hypothetical protein
MITSSLVKRIGVVGLVVGLLALAPAAWADAPVPSQPDGGEGMLTVSQSVPESIDGPAAILPVDANCPDADLNGLCDDGTTYKTIQAAIAAAASGDTINVAAWTYVEVGQIVIAKSLTLPGAGSAATIIKPAQDTGGSDDARMRQAAEGLNQAKDLREKACRDLRQTLSIAYNDSQRLKEQLGYLDQHQLSIAKAREAYRRQFDIGQRTLLDLLDTENEYFQARRAYVNAVYDQRIAEARTLAGIGRLMPALEVAREDLPSGAALGQDRTGIDPQSVCPPDAPVPLQVDKEAVFAEAMRQAGSSR